MLPECGAGSDHAHLCRGSPGVRYVSAPAFGHDIKNALNEVGLQAGERIQIIRVQFEGLPEIERAILFERCGN
jgi:hypothetical protein